MNKRREKRKQTLWSVHKNGPLAYCVNFATLVQLHLSTPFPKSCKQIVCFQDFLVLCLKQGYRRKGVMQ